MIDASVSFHGWQSWRSHDTVAASAQIGLRILNEMGTPETRQVLVKIYVFHCIPKIGELSCSQFVHINFLKTDPNLWFAGSSS